MVVFDPNGDDGLRQCVNATLAECKWLLAATDPGSLCLSCVLTRTRPADADTAGLAAFAKAEAAKRRLIFQLLDLRLPLGGELTFDLLSSHTGPVVTGQDQGVITIDLAESNDARREQRRAALGEAYRTSTRWCAACASRASRSRAADAFGFSRQSFYATQAALDEGGLPALVPGRPGPKRAHKLSAEVLSFCRERLEVDPELKPRDLVAQIAERFEVHVHPRSIERALARQVAGARKPEK